MSKWKENIVLHQGKTELSFVHNGHVPIWPALVGIEDPRELA